MQFVTNGPDIPEALLEAHEEGRVVFFCGAGISRPAGLPSFKGLVNELYGRLGTSHTPIELDAYNRNQFDATLDLLERRIRGNRIAVRQALVKALEPKLRRKGATDTHVALLQLGRCRDGALRLVTTNFDRVFAYVAKRDKLSVVAHAAPMLPIPKNSRWDGLVYLHGLLPAKPDESALHRLVLTSGDFGLAYLTERWAARFVSELFRNFVVCFVGYSINDPVLRYMMDALAADRMLGEVTPQAYAFGDFEPGQEVHKKVEWEAKGVAPILYEVPTGTDNHSALHNCLKAWAETYRDGVLGKERIVVSYALAKPASSSRQDDFVGRMLWALSDQNGLPAKRFADLNPVPPIEWLAALCDERFRFIDLRRFGVPPLSVDDDKLRFSLTGRPTPYTHAPWMSLTSSGSSGSGWDDVMWHIGRWLTRHLDDPQLILWISERGGRLNAKWRAMLESELERLALLQRDGRVAELDEIRAHAPNAIPRPMMSTLWRLLLHGRVRVREGSADLYRWKTHFIREGMTASLRLELRDLLAPRIALRKPIRWSASEQPVGPPVRIRQLVDWDIVIADDQVRSALRDITDVRWHTALPTLVDDFQQLLRDALDLMSELGEADKRSDRSHWVLPSISHHWQNHGFRGWATLIELVRDAWLATRTSDMARARRIALEWYETPYPTFKRLALFAASQDASIDPSEWAEWLLADRGWSLWSVEVKREAMRLLVFRGASLDVPTQQRLEAAILAGPPRDMHSEELEFERWVDIANRAVWLRLAKLEASGVVLGANALDRLMVLSTANPEWQLTENERDEFRHWTSGTGDPDFEANRDIDVAPRTRKELVAWLKRAADAHRPLYEDTWSDICRTRFFHSAFALCDIARENLWPTSRWEDAFQAWSVEGHVARSWHYLAPLLQSMPEDIVLETVHSFAQWLEAASKEVSRHEPIFLALCRRILDLPLDAATGITRNGEPLQPVSEAINHPVGRVTQALLNLWFEGHPNDGDGLAAKFGQTFSRLCDTQVERFRHGRVMLASNLIALFRVDRDWTVQYLLPLFSWTVDSAEAKAAWEGFLWSPRLYRPLLIAFKSEFLETARRYRDLGEHSGQFAIFLTYAALEPLEGYSAEDFRLAAEALPEDGLLAVAQALSRALEASGDQREDYWRNRVQPFWQRIWPKSGDRASAGIALALASLSIAAGEEFPAALRAVDHWLLPIEHPYVVLNQLQNSGLCDRFPLEVLRLMHAIHHDQSWASQDLRVCLDAILRADPDIAQDSRYTRLREYARRRGG